MLGAFIDGTASSIVIPVVGQLKMAQESKTILILESAVGNVLSLVIGLAFFEALKLGQVNFGLMLGSILAGFLFPSIIGVLGGIVWSFLIDKMRNLQNSIFTTPAFVLLSMALLNYLVSAGLLQAWFLASRWPIPMWYLIL